MRAPSDRAILLAMAANAPAIDADPLARIARRFPDVRLVVLYGSLARAQALPTSDADIAVLGGTFWGGLSLGAELGAVLGREPHVVELEHASDLLRIEVARDGKLLYERDPDTWMRFRAEALVRWLDLAPLVKRCADGVRERLRREASRG